MKKTFFSKKRDRVNYVPSRQNGKVFVMRISPIRRRRGGGISGVARKIVGCGSVDGWIVGGGSVRGDARKS